MWEKGSIGLFFIKVAVVGLSILMSSHGNTPAQPFLNEKKLINICQGVELDVGYL